MDRRRFLNAAAGLAAGSGLGPVLPCAAAAAARIDPGERGFAQRAPFRLAVAAYSYRQYLQGANRSMNLVDFIRKCAEIGADGAELTEYYFEKPVTQEQVLKLKRAAQVWGQTITGTPIGNSFTLPRGPERERQIETYKRWVDVSAALGSPAIRTFAGSAPRGVPEPEARRHVVECLNEVCAYAGDKGVFVALENHGGVVAAADGLLEILHAVESPWLALNLDTGNFRTEDPYADVARCAPHAVTVQFKVEMHPKGGGTVPADFDRILKILREANYHGFITLEYEAREDPMTAVPRHLAEMRRRIAAPAG